MAPAAMMDSRAGDLKAAGLFNISRRNQICQFAENPSGLCSVSPHYMGCYGCEILRLILTVADKTA